MLDHPHARPFSSTTSFLSLVYSTLGKRLLDIAIAILLLPILFPMIGLLWMLMRLQGGSGFYCHKRVGRNGAEFSCWKIRTMVPNAERLLTELLDADPLAADEWKRTQKLSRDPRITKLGQFLRRTSLDELPQIWNVLRGDMSFVGPRPVTKPELDRYGPDAKVYLKLRPGITGLWQIMGRSDGCYTERLRLDMTYARAITPLRDLTLILRTAAVIFRPTGR
ncbi:MAG: sugar transferase [Pseudomonadota bacterium]